MFFPVYYRLLSSDPYFLNVPRIIVYYIFKKKQAYVKKQE